MNNLFAWMKSTRSILAVMSMVLLFVIVIGSLIGAHIPAEVLTLAAGAIGGVFQSYFGKRDTDSDRGLSDGSI